MKKNYTKPEILVSKFDVETSITADASLHLTATIYTTAEGTATKDAVAVVDYTKIFAK